MSQPALQFWRNPSVHVSHTGAVRSVWRRGRLPHAVVSAQVAVHRILGDAVAVFAVESTVNALLVVGADELSIDWAVRLVARCPWKRLFYRVEEQLHCCASVRRGSECSRHGGSPCTVMVRLQVRLFPAASVAVYWTSVSPTGKREPGLWLLVSVRRPPEREMDI